MFSLSERATHWYIGTRISKLERELKALEHLLSTAFITNDIDISILYYYRNILEQGKLFLDEMKERERLRRASLT